MQSNSSNPIGIFDSGIGGLTVAKAITHALPHENIIYFGDTAHLPWGDKSTAAIQAYSIKICDMLLRQHCKIILIACHSASAAAFELVREYVGKKAIVLNVIDPVINFTREHFAGKTIGLIGTKQTVSSNTYKKKIDELGLDIQLNSLATPLLAPMIEEGFSNKKILDEVIAEYLQNPTLGNIDALILGCTHYPLVKQQIDQYYQKQVHILDSAEITAQALKSILEFNNLLSRSAEKLIKKFYVSDYTQSFEASTRIFFNEQIHLEHYPLWE